MDVLIGVLAQALDVVEIAYLGASTNHGRRIAVLCAAMGRHLGMNEDELSDLVTCALLHDNALTEYFLLLKDNAEWDVSRLGAHCKIGQRNAEILPFKGTIGGYILYHHERADGRGPFNMTEGYYPQAAELIAAADMIDVESPLYCVPPEELPALRKRIDGDIHRRFTGKAGNALLGGTGRSDAGLTAEREGCPNRLRRRSGMDHRRRGSGAGSHRGVYRPHYRL